MDEELEVYTDSSYGPGGLESQGTVVVMWGRSPMMWKAGRQPSPALSTAESELSEAIEGLTMGDSVDVLLQEMVRRSYGRVIKVDNQAAVSLLSEPAGSWRTRHLRLRAAHLRWRLSRAVPGSEQIADVGTKPMTAPKLREMRRMLGMGLREEESEARIECEKGAEKGAEDEVEEMQDDGHARGGLRSEDLERAANLIRIASILGAWIPVEAQVEEDPEDTDDLWKILVFVMFALIGVVALGKSLVSMMQKWCVKGPPCAEVRVDSGGDEGAEEFEEVMIGLRQRGGGRVEKSSGSSDQVVRADGGSLADEEKSSGSVGVFEEAVYVTRWGVRWHVSADCPTLHASEPRVSLWCEICARGVEKAGGIYAHGPGLLAHLDPECPSSSGSMRFYPRRCQMCLEKKKNSGKQKRTA